MKLASFEALAAALETAGVRYLMAGGLAGGAHGYLRFTKGVDVVIQLIPDNIERAFAALGSLDYRPIVSTTRERFAQLRLHPFFRNSNAIASMKRCSGSSTHYLLRLE
jgi:hypothetical protein